MITRSDNAAVSERIRRGCVKASGISLGGVS